MAELVREQDGHERERESEAVEQHGGVGPQNWKDVDVIVEIERAAVIERLRQYYADDGGGDESED